MISDKQLPLKSISLVTALNLLSALVGLLQTVVIAWLFGATRAVEIFFAAITFQTSLLQLTSSGQIGDLFTPIYHRIAAERGPREARHAFAAMTNVMLLCTATVAGLAGLCAQPISTVLVPGFSEADQVLTSKVFLAVAPLIILQIANAMYTNLLRADHQYGVAEATSLIARVANLVMLLCLSQTLGLWALILGLWVSALIGLIGQFWFAHRNGPRHRLILRTAHFRPRAVLIKIPLAFTHILSAQFLALALTASLSMLPEGSFAAFRYAQRLRTKAQGIVLQPVGIVFFNHFSESLAQGAKQVRSYAEHALGLTLAAVAFCIAPIAAGGDLLLAGLWGNEKFPLTRIEQTYFVLIALTCLLVLNAQYLIARRTNLALGIVGRQFIASGIVLALVAIACYWVIPRFGLVGAVAIQAAAAFGTAVASLTVLAVARRDLVCILPIFKLAQWIVATCAAVGLARLARTLIPSIDSLSGAASIGSGLLIAAVAIVCLSAVSLVMRIPEAHELLGKLRQRVSRWRGSQATVS